jgi:DNA-binding transcriptional ArsR family regulator
VFKALAQETRLKMLAALSAAPRTVQELAADADVSEPTASHHLAVLRAAGLVTMEKDGVIHRHALDAKALQAVARAIAQPRGFVETPNEDAPRAVQNYLTSDGRLKSFPATRKKRREILAWMMKDFAEGRRYREAEVNDIIARRHGDVETFRREFIGYAMMAREKGLYWRLPEAGWAKD